MIVYENLSLIILMYEYTSHIYICLSICLSVCLSVYLSVCLSIYFFVYIYMDNISVKICMIISIYDINALLCKTYDMTSKCYCPTPPRPTPATFNVALSTCASASECCCAIPPENLQTSDLASSACASASERYYLPPLPTPTPPTKVNTQKKKCHKLAFRDCVQRHTLKKKL